MVDATPQRCECQSQFDKFLPCYNSPSDTGMRNNFQLIAYSQTLQLAPLPEKIRAHPKDVVLIATKSLNFFN